MTNSDHIPSALKKSILLSYMTQIRLKVALSKKRALENLQLRSDSELLKISKEKNFLNVINVAENEHGHKIPTTEKLSLSIDQMEIQFKSLMNESKNK